MQNAAITPTRMCTTVAALVAGVALAAGCTGDIVGTATTDFGDAVVTSERATGGDIYGWMTDPGGLEEYGEIGWSATDGRLQARVADQEVLFEGVMELEDVPLEKLNLMLYSLWDIERADPAEPHCMGNDIAICCRDDGWRCRAQSP